MDGQLKEHLSSPLGDGSYEVMPDHADIGDLIERKLCAASGTAK